MRARKVLRKQELQTSLSIMICCVITEIKTLQNPIKWLIRGAESDQANFGGGWQTCLIGNCHIHQQLNQMPEGKSVWMQQVSRAEQWATGRRLSFYLICEVRTNTSVSCSASLVVQIMTELKQECEAPILHSTKVKELWKKECKTIAENRFSILKAIKIMSGRSCQRNNWRAKWICGRWK